MTFENEIVKKTILGVLSILGLGICSSAAWSFRTIQRHEQQIHDITRDIRDIRRGVYLIGKKVGVKDYELLPLLDMDR